MPALLRILVQSHGDLISPRTRPTDSCLTETHRCMLEPARFYRIDLHRAQWRTNAKFSVVVHVAACSGLW